MEISQESDIPVETENVVEMFGKWKKVVDSEDDAFAKKVTTPGGRQVFFVKFGPDGFMYNPARGYSMTLEYRRIDHLGRPVWSFREVPEKAFNFYVKFLASNNTAYVTNAERSLA